ncbi:MAG: cytochrome c [Deltaproteobacteria bacterium]|nr:cytochrome c [Deltaproteobacteria bacterium]
MTEVPEKKAERFEQMTREHPDIHDIHNAVLREQFSPREGAERVPVLLFIGILAIVMWGGYYLSEYDASFQARAYDGPAAFAPSAAAPSVDEEPVQADPMKVGKRVYARCISCHQQDGKGLGSQYPPLAGSTWVTGDERVLARILVGGLNGPIEVSGRSYNGAMPAWRQLSDVEIASVLTYIRGSFGNQALPVAPEVVAEARADQNKGPWTARELQELGSATEPEAVQ